jgi:hypothetical protein
VTFFPAASTLLSPHVANVVMMPLLDNGRGEIMLTFNLFTADEYTRSHRVVHIDPATVASVEESERHPAFGDWYQVAIITLMTGDKYVVEDGSRSAVREIAETQAEIG